VIYYRDLQTWPQTHRFQVLRLVHDLLRDFRAAVIELGEESLLSLVDLVNGEKDPRNLMINFSILHAVISEWDISKHVEVWMSTLRNFIWQLTSQVTL